MQINNRLSTVLKWCVLLLLLFVNVYMLYSLRLLPVLLFSLWYSTRWVHSLHLSPWPTRVANACYALLIALLLYNFATRFEGVWFDDLLVIQLLSVDDALRHAFGNLIDFQLHTLPHLDATDSALARLYEKNTPTILYSKNGKYALGEIAKVLNGASKRNQSTPLGVAGPSIEPSLHNSISIALDLRASDVASAHSHITSTSTHAAFQSSLPDYSLEDEVRIEHQKANFGERQRESTQLKRLRKEFILSSLLHERTSFPELVKTVIREENGKIRTLAFYHMDVRKHTIVARASTAHNDENFEIMLQFFKKSGISDSTIARNYLKALCTHENVITAIKIENGIQMLTSFLTSCKGYENTLIASENYTGQLKNQYLSQATILSKDMHYFESSNQKRVHDFLFKKTFAFAINLSNISDGRTESVAIVDSNHFRVEDISNNLSKCVGQKEFNSILRHYHLF